MSVLSLYGPAPQLNFCSLVLVRHDDEELEELREEPRDAASYLGPC